MRIFCIIAYITFILSISYAQNKKIDSLFTLLKTAKEDTNKVNILIQLADELSTNVSPDTAITLSTQALKLTEKLKWEIGIGKSYHIYGWCYYLKGNYAVSLSYYSKALAVWEKLNENKSFSKSLILTLQSKTLSNIGNVYSDQADYPKALEYYFKSLRMDEELGNKNGIAALLSNIGIVYKEQADYPKALDCYFKALRMDEELGNKRDIATDLSNIGIVYAEQANYPKALEYYFKALRMDEELGNKRDIAIDLSNIGNAYTEQANYPKALEYYFKALRMDEELGNKNGIATKLGNIGIVYEGQADYSKALEYYFKALRIFEELGDKRGVAINLGNIGSLYTKTGQFKEAEKYLKQAIVISDSVGILSYTRDFELYITRLYDTTGRYKLAFEHYKKYIAARDTVDNEEKRKKQAYIEMNHKFEMDAAKMKAEHEKKMAIAREEQRRQQIITYFIAVGLAVTLLFSVFIFRSLKITQKQKDIIEQQKQIVEQQKQLVEEKNKEITDSINYAKRIQEAILPNGQRWKELLPQSFILYLPKDIVAGDFYWMEETEDYIFVAAADSTGHGVPGAMVSVVCSGALTKIVREEHLRDTGKILDKAREIVTEQLSSGEQQLRDGMDVCLVRIDKNNSKKIQYSGANRSLVIIRNGEVIEIKADKQPVGFDEDAKMFAQHDIELQSGDSVYLFTDGYADQFGGEKNKKIGSKRFLEMLKEVSKYKVHERGEKLQEVFEEWKKDQFQVDDVTVIGVDF